MYKIRSETDFEQRSKSVFDSLSSLESNHKIRETEYTENNENFLLNEAEDEKKIENFDSATTSQTINFEFKTPNINLYKRQLELNGTIPSAKHHKKEPDYILNPDKWQKYSLEDVDESQLSASANYRAAMSFLNKREITDKTSNEDFNRLPDNVVFNKPISKTKYINSKLVYDKVGKNLLNNLDENEESEIQQDFEKMEIETQCEENLFKKATRFKNIRKKHDDEPDEADDTEKITEQVSDKNQMVTENEYNAGIEQVTADNLDDYEYEKSEDEENENEIGLDFDKY